LSFAFYKSKNDAKYSSIPQSPTQHMLLQRCMPGTDRSEVIYYVCPMIEDG